ncbi:phosphotransferase [Ruegeria sp.]|uniref:phosphotransferase n=1 Tax=Ruegeria sp. TaxID=1879320 RepID=UPI003B5B0010
MLDLTESEKSFVSRCVAEFLPDGRVRGLACTYRSHAFPEARQVLRLETDTGIFALKIDRESPATGRLRNEFNLLTDLHDYFAGNSSSQVIRPIYLSPTQTFFVTEFIDRPTAVDLIHNSKDDDQVAQVFRRAGAWLSDFHSRLPPVTYAFRPKWMTDDICQLLGDVPHHIAKKSQSMVNTMLTESQQLRGIEELRVFAHGDFHGQNLIIGQGKTFGLDFTEVGEKLAIYDMVDFLKADIFRDSSANDVDRSGILRRNKQMFLRRYRLPIDPKVLDFCIRGRLLRDWLDYWRVDFQCSAFEEVRRSRLEMRLDIAFSHED